MGTSLLSPSSWYSPGLGVETGREDVSSGAKLEGSLHWIWTCVGLKRPGRHRRGDDRVGRGLWQLGPGALWARSTRVVRTDFSRSQNLDFSGQIF